MWHSKINRPRAAAAAAATALLFQLRPQLFGMSQPPPPWFHGPLPPSLAVDSCWFHAIFMNASGRADALFGPWLMLLRLLALLPFGRQFAVLCCAVLCCSRLWPAQICVTGHGARPGFLFCLFNCPEPDQLLSMPLLLLLLTTMRVVPAAFCCAASPKRCMPQLTLRLFLAYSLTRFLVLSLSSHLPDVFVHFRYWSKINSCS